MITLRFCDGNSYLTSAIQRAEYGFWATHVEALMPDGTLLGAYIDSGVQARPRDYDNGHFTREEFVNIDAAPESCDRFHAFLRAQLGKPYDTTAILGFVAARDCSQRIPGSAQNYKPPHWSHAVGLLHLSRPNSTTSPHATCS